MKEKNNFPRSLIKRWWCQNLNPDLMESKGHMLMMSQYYINNRYHLLRVNFEGYGEKDL